MVTWKFTQPKGEVRRSKRNRGSNGNPSMPLFDSQHEEDFEEEPANDTKKRRRIDVTSNHPENQDTRPRFLPANFDEDLDPAAPCLPSKHIYFLPGRHQYTSEGVHIDQQDYLVVRRHLTGTNHATQAIESKRIVQRFPHGLPRDWRDTETLKQLNSWMYVTWFTPAKQHDWTELKHTEVQAQIPALGSFHDQPPESNCRPTPGGLPDYNLLAAHKRSSKHKTARPVPQRSSKTTAPTNRERQKSTTPSKPPSNPLPQDRSSSAPATSTPPKTNSPRALDTAPFPASQSDTPAPSPAPSLPPRWPRTTPRPKDHKRTTKLVRRIPQYASSLWILSTPLDNGRVIQHTARDEYLKGWIGETKWKQWNLEEAHRDVEQEAVAAGVKNFWKDYLEVVRLCGLGEFDVEASRCHGGDVGNPLVTERGQERAFEEDFGGLRG